jgi:hypothetical protein
MNASAKRVLVLLAALLFCLGIPAVGSADAVWGTGLAYVTSEPGFEGYWEYCFHIYWDTTEYGGQGMSHTTIYLALAECVCACEEGYFGFHEIAGVGVGEGGCELDYYGEFDCDGDPHFPIEGPTVKFEPFEDVCEPGSTGWVHVCYFSLFPPTDPGIFEDHLGIKFGQNVETGDLDGVLPYCECDQTPTEPSAWGVIKSLYR